MTETDTLPATLEPHSDTVQLYGADETLTVFNVSRFLREGLEAGEGVVVIASDGHNNLFISYLREQCAGFSAALRRGQIRFLSASGTLVRFMTGGMPDAALFQETLEDILGGVRSRSECTNFRVYGEMVGILWLNGEYKAALRLEELWNRTLEKPDIRLFCGYPIDVLSKEFHGSMRTTADVLGEDEENAAAIRDRIATPGRVPIGFTCTPFTRTHLASAPALPEAEPGIFALQTSAPGDAEAIFSRARRSYAEESRFRAMVENSSDAIALCDAAGVVIYSSPSTSRVLDTAPEDMTGRNWRAMVHPDDVAAFDRVFASLLRRPRLPEHIEMRVCDGECEWRWIEGTASNLLEDRAVGGIVLNYRDVTAAKKADEECRRDAEELRRSNAELQSFAWAASHDLKEPLRTVCSYAQLLAEEGRTCGERRKFAEIVIDGVTRMSALLDDMLALASIGFEEPRGSVVLSQTAARVLLNLEQAIDECGAVIEVDQLPVVRGYESHMVLLLQNLVSNALKYRGTATPRIHIAAERRGSEWVVKVQDNGIGIALEHRERIFGLFKRLHGPETPGTGLGLTLCRKIVEGNGGRIWVESNVEGGSTFCFTARPGLCAEKRVRGRHRT